MCQGYVFATLKSECVHVCGEEGNVLQIRPDARTDCRDVNNGFILSTPSCNRESESIAQSYPSLCDTMDCSPPGSSLHGILQAEYWSGLPFPSPGDPPNPGIKPRSPAWQTASSPSEPPGKPLLITDWVHIAVVRIWRTHKQHRVFIFSFNEHALNTYLLCA